MRIMQISWIACKKLGNGIYLLEHELGFSIFTTMGPEAFAYGYGCFATCGEAFKSLGVVYIRHEPITSIPQFFAKNN